MTRDRFATLTDEIARTRSRIAALEAEQGREVQRLQELEAALAAAERENTGLGAVLSAPSTISVSTAPPVEKRGRSSAEKVAIFRSLFRGRADVYPTRFVSREGKQGYGPACANKFVKGKCELPRVKCRECPNQAFLPADDEAYLAHLRGEHVMGVYPMLPDGTCWFLAVDFDKATWTDDVRAFVATCRRLDLPFAVERSRSGNGAHVWLFFSAPVSAWAARKLGCYVLTETMAARHELSFDSYDRLFPSQDHMPKGGFGNLIALPLQREARTLGVTLRSFAGTPSARASKCSSTPCARFGTVESRSATCSTSFNPAGSGLSRSVSRTRPSRSSTCRSTTRLTTR
jgi:hypothetical protein